MTTTDIKVFIRPEDQSGYDPEIEHGDYDGQPVLVFDPNCVWAGRKVSDAGAWQLWYELPDEEAWDTHEFPGDATPEGVDEAIEMAREWLRALHAGNGKPESLALLSQALGHAIKEKQRVYASVLSDLGGPVPVSIYDAQKQGLLKPEHRDVIRKAETDYVTVLKVNREWYRQNNLEIPRHLAKRQQMVLVTAPPAHDPDQEAVADA